MKSIRIQRADHFDTIKDIWIRTLQWDPEWHFFFEGNYMVVRCGDAYAPIVEAQLGILLVPFISEGEWIDNIPTTRMNQDLYKQMFHAFSELSMRTRPEEMYNVIDRVLHCFMNNMRSPERLAMPHLPQGYDDLMWEPMNIVVNALLRVSYISYNRGIIHGRK